MTCRHRKRVATYFLLGLLLVQEVGCRLPEEISIGGLFGDDESKTTENTFKYASYWINHERVLGRTRLQFDTRRLPSQDTFSASKEVCSQVKQNTVAMFGPRSTNIASFTNSLCSALHIPHIEFREDGNNGYSSGYSINLYPDAQQLAKAYLDVINYHNMKELLIVYEEKEGLVKMQTILRKVSTDPSKNVYIRQADKSNMRAVLKEAKKKRWTNIIADLNSTTTALFLKTALQEGMIDPYHHYIFTTLDIDSVDMDDYKYNYVNLTGFRIVDPEDTFTQGIMQQMLTYEQHTGLTLMNRFNSRTIPHESALLFDAVLLLATALKEMDRTVDFRPINVSCDTDYVWPTGRTLNEFLTMAHVKGTTGNLVINQGRRLNFKLDVMQLSEKGLYKAGFWTSEKGFNFTYTEMGPSLLGNKTLVVTTVLEEPYVMIKEEYKNKTNLEGYGNEIYEGFCIDMLKEISQIVHFDYKVVPTPDGRYGVITNGKWDGVIQQLIDRKADMAMAALTINYLREQYIDFTKPFLNLGISILFKMPKREKPGLFSFLNPLAIEIWIYVIAAYLLVSFSMFVLARFSPYEWYNPHPCNPETDTVRNTFNISNSFWFTVGTLMQQGSDINPRAVSTRIVGGTWWFFTLIIISSYTANLAAFLTVDRMSTPIKSAEDLARQTDILYGTLSGGSTYSFFRDSTIEIYQQMWNFMTTKDRKDGSVFVSSLKEGVERVMNSNYAFFMESTTIEYMTQRNCELMQIGGLLDSKGFGIGTPRDSPLRDKLSLAILNLQEGGRIQVLYNKWWKSTGKCFREDSKETKANALGVENVGGIFVVLLGGLVLAVIVAFFEFLWKSKRNAQEDRQSLCSEMAEELRFAVRCHGSSKKPKIKRTCTKCRKRHMNHCKSTEVQIDSPNGIVLREMKKSPLPMTKEYQYTESGYLHVDYSDTDN